MAGVIRVIGWSMILLAVLVRLPVAVVGAVGVAIIAGHNLLDPYMRTLIHALALVVSQIRLGFVSPWLFENHPMGVGPAPDGYMWSLALLYLVFAVTIVILYFPCRWFAGLKSRRKDWWLGYL